MRVPLPVIYVCVFALGLSASYYTTLPHQKYEAQCQRRVDAVIGQMESFSGRNNAKYADMFDEKGTPVCWPLDTGFPGIGSSMHLPQWCYTHPKAAEQNRPLAEYPPPWMEAQWLVQHDGVSGSHCVLRVGESTDCPCVDGKIRCDWR